MKISKVEFWNSPMLWTIVLKTILKISRHAENHVKNFKAYWKIVFKMHYRFQHVLKFSFQHALQISEHSEIFKMLFQDVFQHISNIKIHLWYEPCWKLLKTMSSISKCVEKPCWKFQGLGRTAEKGMTWLTWPFENIFHRTNTVKI